MVASLERRNKAKIRQVPHATLLGILFVYSIERLFVRGPVHPERRRYLAFDALRNFVLPMVRSGRVISGLSSRGLPR
jgi:hypothetical protein